MASNYNQTAPAGTTGYNDPEGTHGPHSSRVANAVDPRVDSDRDHRGAPGAGVGSAGYGASTTTTAGTGVGATTTGHGTHTTTGATAGTENTGERAARNVKGVFAQGHVCPSFFLLPSFLPSFLHPYCFLFYPCCFRQGLHLLLA